MEDSRLRRIAACTETAWCRAVPVGTGTAVLALTTTNDGPNPKHLQNALNKLQNSHPVLKSKLHFNPISSTFSFLTSPTPFVQIKKFEIPETSKILNDQNTPNDNNDNNPHAISISPLQILLEHELNENAVWQNLHYSDTAADTADMLFVTMYAVGSGKWVIVFRLHVAACDRTTAVSLLEELLVLMSGGDDGGGDKKGEMELGLEDLVPRKLAKKPLLARGLNMISYSVNSLRLTNLKFKDVKSTRRSQVARLQMNHNQTQKILSECKSRGMKLSSVMVAAGLMSAHSSGGHQRKYGIITLIDCRRFLDPPLTSHNFGFYHAAILNSYTVRGGEDLWELAKKISTTLEASKNSNKHFTDMSDLNFLLCRTIENPTLTASGAMRTALMTVFEDTVVDDSGGMQNKIGVEDYMGCASVHGIGPSVAVFDTVRDGRLDCVCVYPAPLHSREQMEALVHNMKALLIKG